MLKINIIIPILRYASVLRVLECVCDNWYDNADRTVYGVE